MTWQDAVIAAGQAVFMLALLPAVVGREKPPRSTCLLTGVTLAVCAAALLMSELSWGGCAMALTAALWLVLLFQRRVK